MQHADDKNRFDYFIHFEEDKPADDLAKAIREALTERGLDSYEYDDYGTLGTLGW
jgi:hypothetical protein